LDYAFAMSTKVPRKLDLPIGPDVRIAILAARFNAEIVEALLDGCVNRLIERGINESHIDVRHVPGAFELPLAAKVVAQTRRFAAVICLGAVIRGDTPHFDYVAGNCAAGIARVSLDEKLPVIFGVLTTNTDEQARDRIGGRHGHAGQNAADAAVEMVMLMNGVRT
jgi:6,7-dimethyl-8-ribityllumazine synthase